MHLLQNLSRRDGVLILIGASCVYILTTFLHRGFDSMPSIVINSGLPTYHTPAPILDLGFAKLPETGIIAHAPGWTLFRNLYMSNGTLFLLSSNFSDFPEIRMMTSTGLPAYNTPENIALREPTKQDMDFISPEEAEAHWGGHAQDGERNRIWTVEGNTMLFNDPSQFLDHYYHFVAELLVGARAFIYGAFNPTSRLSLAKDASTPELHPTFNPLPSVYEPPSFSRAIFIHAESYGWRDKPGFNSFVLRSAFPSLTIEVASDWADRVNATAPPKAIDKDAVQHSRANDDDNDSRRAWHFPIALLTDRSAAFRGESCGSRTQRTASEAWEYMVDQGGIDLVGTWWNNVREAVWRFAGVKKQVFHSRRRPDEVNDSANENLQMKLPIPENIVITYVSRQEVRRHLIPEDHDALVDALRNLVKRKKVEEGKDWELNIVRPEMFSKDGQIQLIAKSTILLGVHGNGLTHLVFMKPSQVSAVIEIFYPGGFAHDYEWTTRALGMRHFTVWNDTYFTRPNEPSIGYPEGFQGTSIPVHGETVAQLIEDRLEGRL
ncbi:hypothetical protein BDQ12DRAFT_708463 [Crucibulum laeve]|uniref:Glycosyltransferase 61 catalytic domain-containing protein n=1 Tax=Crucibulum laeve TaxID=68775 RepID=A0A5C3MJG8_9AGAR|nr:hypothetical protein BDQ12DRAFT_708463 [Crucibulum laeve]